MFVVIYKPTTDIVTIDKHFNIKDGNPWRIDTDPETGSVDMYEELEEALDRVKDIRSKGGEACLAVMIE